MLALLALLACSPDDTGTDAALVPDAVETEPFTGRPVAEPVGACPVFDAPGTQDLEAGGVDRQIEAYWPVNHEGPIGLVYAWHGLGDRADNFAAAFDAERFAKVNDVVVVVPWSQNPDLLTWAIVGDGGADLALFEQVRNCAAQRFELDESRVWSTGFSFGALWTTYLTLHASDVLAGTAIFSGGTGESIGMPYFAPAYPIPVLAAWGGDRDAFDAGVLRVEFAATTADLTDGLEADGHTVVRCDHGLGHTVPFEWEEIVGKFLLTSRFGEPSPYADGDTSDLPDYCF